MKIDMLLPFMGEFAVARVAHRKELKFGLINRSGIFVVHPIYDMIDYNYQGGDYVCVNMGYKDGRIYEHCGKWGVVNTKGENIIPLKYSQMQPWDDREHFTVCYRNKWGVINIKDEIVLPFMPLGFLGTPNFKGWLYASVGGKKGYIDMTGKQMIKIIYDELAPIFSESPNEWLSARIGDECFYIDQNGKRILF